MHKFIKKESVGSGTTYYLLCGNYIIIIILIITMYHYQAVWVLKMRALTLQVYVDDIEGEEEGIAETLLDNYAISSMPRPGTSLKNPGSTYTGQGVRPKSQSGLCNKKFTLKTSLEIFKKFQMKLDINILKADLSPG